MSRPTFITTKGDRNGMEDQLDTSTLIEYYRNTAIGHYEWSGSSAIMDAVPLGFIEDTLFCYGNISAKKISGLGWRFMATKPVHIDMYGQTYDWLPDAELNHDTNIAGICEPSKNPVLNLGVSMARQIQPYLDIMATALRVMDVNIVSLSQPVVVEGLTGELDGKLFELDLKAGKRFIPAVKKDSLGLNVLDLKATDNTQNLASTVMFCHAKIMDILDMPNANLRSSGISDMETANANAGLTLYNDWGLKRRQQWCDRMNALYPHLELSVKVARGWDVPEGSPAETKEDEMNIGATDDTNEE